MPYNPEKIGHVDVYYHALVLYAANWTAYVASMAVLLGTGVLLSLAEGPAGLRMWGAGVASGIAFGGAIYFIDGLGTYGEMLCEAVLSEYLTRTHRFAHPRIVRVCQGLALLCLMGNLYMLWDLSGLTIPLGL